MGIAAPFDIGNRIYGNPLAEETRHRETKRPGRLGFKVSRKKGTRKPWCRETLEATIQGARERWSRGIDLTRNHG
jgi:hypothetical protein